MSNLEQSKEKITKAQDRVKFSEVIEGLKEEKHGLSIQLFWFIFLSILSLCLAYLSPYSLIVTIPCVIVPSWFAFNSVNSLKGLKNNQRVSFFLAFKNYYSYVFFGGYRLLLGLLKSFLAYILSSSIGYIIFDRTVLSGNAEYNAIIQKLTTDTDVSALTEEILQFMSKEEFQKPLFLISSISLLLAILVFAHHVLKHSPKMRRNLFVKAVAPMRLFHSVDIKVRKDNRKFIFSSYFFTTWFIQLLVIIAGAGGIVLSYFVLKQLDPLQAVVISLFLILIVTAPLLNYINVVQSFIYLKLADKYEQAFVTMTLEFLNKYKEKIGIEEEQANQIQKFLESQRDQTEEDKEDNDDEEE